MVEDAQMSTADALEAFVRLAREARRRALPQEDRTRLVALDEALRDRIDGSRPAPTTSEGRPEPAPPGDRETVHAVMEELTVHPQTARKLHRVGLDRVHSTYTPSRRPTFLDAYFEDAVDDVEALPGVSPAQVVDVDGQPVDLPDRTRELWNVGVASGRPPPRGEVNVRPSAPSAPEDEAPKTAPVVGPATRPAGPRVTPATESPDPGLAAGPRVTPAAESPDPGLAAGPRVTPATEGPDSGLAAGARVSAATEGPDSGPATRPAGAQVTPARDGPGATPPSSAATLGPDGAEPRVAAPAATPETSDPARADARPGAPERTRHLPPAIIHFLEDERPRRGFISGFDAGAGRIMLVSKDQPDVEQEIRLDTVLVIFFGRRSSEPASPKAGVRVEVTLVNDRRVTGFSPDYAPNGSALTIVPERDRGGVDRVWVPGWSAKAIQVST
jgi:hypothetical protein